MDLHGQPAGPPNLSAAGSARLRLGQGMPGDLGLLALASHGGFSGD